LFEPVEDAYGSRLALVFGNEFAKGECPFYTAKQCNHCDIGAGEGKQFDSEMNLERLGFFQKQYDGVLRGIEHLVIYNSGSTLNKREMSRETLGIVLDYASSLEKCKVVSLDSREMYVTKDSLDYVASSLREDQQARVILGVESQSDEVRIGKLNKKMTKQGIERAFSVVGQYNGKVAVDVNIVFQPPELSGEDAIAEAVQTLKYGLELGEQYGVPVDFNFHPYYQSEKSKGMFPDHPRADLQDAKEALRRMKAEIGNRDTKIFVGWQDEEHDQQSVLRERELDEETVVLNSFNVTQDVQYLD
jgi:radical SAM enzyme (TIGR01210 family)